MRQLRHDFRAYYGVRYEDVGAAEAIDLIETLPMGSLWLSEASPAAEWSEERYLLTHILNTLLVQAHGKAFEGEPELIEFPSERAARAEQLEQARKVRERLNNTKWKEIEANG